MVYAILISVFLIILLPLLIPKDHWLRYYACYATYIIISLICPLILLPLYIVSPKKASMLIWKIGNFVSYLLGITWETRNGHLLEKYDKVIIVANHQSIYDMLGFIVVLKNIYKYNTVAKRGVFYVFPLGLFLWLMGVVFIDRKKGEHAMQLMRNNIKKCEARRIIIFPEGTRNFNGKEFLPFKKGAFRLAIDLQIPIVPMVVSPFYFIKPKESFAGGKVIFSILEPFEVNTFGNDVESLTNRVKITMDQEYVKLKNEINE